MKNGLSICWLLGLVLACGCQPPAQNESANLGHFEGEIVASWDQDGRNMTLREDFTFVDSQNRRWTAPRGAIVNGASIPAPFWSVIGGPFEGRYRNASVVHDVGCEEMQATWEDVHRMFYEACRCGGVDETQAKMLYYAVYHFGPRWQPASETQLELRETPDGRVIQEPVTVERMVRIDPPPPTLEEVEQVGAFIAEENPNPVAIEQMNRETVRRRPRRGSGRPNADSVGPPSAERFERLAAERDNPEGRPWPTRSRIETNPLNGNPARTRESAPSDQVGNGENRGRGVPAQFATAGTRVGRENLPERWSGPPNRRPTDPPSAVAREALAPAEREWAQERVRQHLEQQAGQRRPADFGVERTADGYRVAVQYLESNAQGQAVPSGNSSVRLSREGRVLEATNGR